MGKSHWERQKWVRAFSPSLGFAVSLFCELLPGFVCVDSLSM